MNKKLVCLLIGALFSATTAMADTLIVEPDRDNTLFEDSQGRYSNGAGQYLFIGRTGGQNGIPPSLRRALVRFDLSSIPVGSQITSASLQMTINKVPPQAGGGTASLHKVESDWGETTTNAPGPEGQGAAAEPGDATWLHTFFNTDFWNTAGGDYAATASQTAGMQSVPQTITFATAAGMVADVEGWVNTPADNFGWVVLGDEGSVENARRLLSRENSDAAGRPILTIEYTPAPPPPLPVQPIPVNNRWGLLLLAGLILLAVRRRRMFP